MITQAMEISRRVETMTTSAVKALQNEMEAARFQTADRFLSGVRERLTPLLADAQATLGTLTASENKLKEESRAIREGFEKYLEQTTQASIAAVQGKDGRDAGPV